VKVEGTKSFGAGRAVVWEVLNDPERMARLMPGVESFEVADDAHWTAKMKIPLGMGGLRMSFNFERTEQREPEYARLRVKGNGVGAIVSMDTEFDLAEAGAGTEMKWQADVRIAGPVGSMGQRVLQPIVNQQVGNVLAALERQVEEAQRGGEPPSAAAPAPESDGRGAEAGIHPGSPEAYPDEPEGAGPAEEPR
jgi:carbon monoxide dehydrogenase subunit G